FVTVESFGYQPRGGGFADAARPRKQVSMVQPAVLDRVLQRAGQNLLAGYVFKFLRAPFARDYLVGHVITLGLVRLRTYPQHTRAWLPLLRSRPGGVHRCYVVRSPKSDETLEHFHLAISNCRF